MVKSTKYYGIRRPWTAFGTGALIGCLGGLIGLGGAEFRLPVLITIFALLAHRAVRFNLLVSLTTLSFALLARFGAGSSDNLVAFADIAIAMIIAGGISAWIGAGALSRIPTDNLMLTIAILLLAIAGLLVAEATNSVAGFASPPTDSVVRFLFSVAAGVLVGAVSSLLGVAGGEFIIPILMFGFGADIKTAGTLSLLISIPIVAIGVAKHKLTGHYRSRDMLIHLVLPMSAGSIVGAVAGGYMSGVVPIDTLRLILAAVLAASAYKLARKSGLKRHKN